MKEIKFIYLLCWFLVVFTSCNTHKYIPEVYLTPKEIKIKTTNFVDGKKIQFRSLNFSTEGSDSIFDSSGVKIMFDTSKSLLILESDFDTIIKKMKISDPKLSKVMKKNKVINHYDLLKLIYNVTPNSEIDNKELLLDLKEIMIPNGVEKAFYELNFEWGKGFQYGTGGAGFVVMDLFHNGHAYFLLFNKFSKEEIDEYLTKIVPYNTSPNL